MGLDEDVLRNAVLFNSSKKELFSISNGFKILLRRLKATWNVVNQRDELSGGVLKGARLLVFAAPKERFTADEFHSIKRFIDEGGSVLMMLTEGGEERLETNVNFLLEEYGVLVNTDAVVRSAYYKYFHPKEVLVSNGVLNREINRAAGKGPTGLGEEDASDSLSFVYPYGATLTVQKPSVVVLSSGTVSYPQNRPVCAFYHNEHGGKLAVLGSAHIFSDGYIDKEENSKLQEIIFKWLTTDDVSLNQIDADNPEISDYHFLPDTGKMADKLKSCLQESEEVPRDFTALFDHTLHALDMKVLPDVLK
jgi:intraflagellar transport protein 52